jgi:hypothetical protein
MKFCIHRILMEANNSTGGSCGDRRTKEKNPSTQEVRTNPKTITTFRNMEFLPVACLQSDLPHARTEYKTF